MRVFRQKDSFSCGPRCLQIALSHFNMYPSYKQVFKLCKTTPEEGTNLDDLVNAAWYFGLKTKTHLDDENQFNFIKKYTDNNFVCILCWYADEEDAHVSVAHKVVGNKIYLLDPAQNLYVEPEIVMRRKSLERCWRDYPDFCWIIALYV